MRYFLELSYNGRDFHGWQSQPNALSVQSTLEGALSTILRQETKITGAGRTDAGVHARQMYAHFDSSSIPLDKSVFLNSLNNLIGNRIFIERIIEVNEDAHARFDALQRTYKYFITYRKDPFLNHYSCKFNSFLDIEKMNKAADILLNTEDFTSFAKLHSDAKTNICKVVKAEWLNIKEDYEAMNFIGNLNEGIVFTITADRFLRNMVRAIVGTLVEVGRGKINLKKFQEIIESKNRCEAGTSMPAYALFLWNIKYPYIQ